MSTKFYCEYILLDGILYASEEKPSEMNLSNWVITVLTVLTKDVKMLKCKIQRMMHHVKIHDTVYASITIRYFELIHYNMVNL